MIVVVVVVASIGNSNNEINFYDKNNADNDKTTDIQTRNARSEGGGAYPEIRVSTGTFLAQATTVGP